MKISHCLQYIYVEIYNKLIYILMSDFYVVFIYEALTVIYVAVI